MGAPNFADLGQNIRDVFRTGYYYGRGFLKLNVKSRSDEKFEVGSDLTYNCEAAKMNGWIETRYKMKEYGTFTEKWTTDGVLFTGYELCGHPMRNVGVHSEFAFNPQNFAKGLKIGVKFSNDTVNAVCSISNDLNSNVNLLGSMVVAFKEFLIGYQGGYNASTSRMTKNDAGLAFTCGNCGFHIRCVSIPYEYGCALLYKINSNVDAAVNGIFAKSNNVKQWTLGAAVKCRIDEKSTLRLKFNTDRQLGTGLQQKLNDNITLLLSFNVDCTNLTRGAHKIGLAVNVEV